MEQDCCIVGNRVRILRQFVYREETHTFKESTDDRWMLNRKEHTGLLTPGEKRRVVNEDAKRRNLKVEVEDEDHWLKS